MLSSTFMERSKYMILQIITTLLFSHSVMSDSSATPWTAAHQVSLSIANSQSLLKLISIELVRPSNRIVPCHYLLSSLSDPITSWQIDGGTVETVTDFIFLGFQITVDGDCSHEIKRRLLLGRKAMTNLDSVIKSRDISLPTKVHPVKAMVFQ